VEVNADTPDPIVTLLSGQSNSERFGGTLKLGAFESTLVNNTKTKAAYNNIESVNERHRHRYGINQAYKNQLEEAGLIVSAYDAVIAVKAMELLEHPWFVDCQYHPEFTSRQNNPNPLIE